MRYIDADKLICSIDNAESPDTEKDQDEVAQVIEEAETAAVEEMRYGEWIMDWDDLWPEDSQIICSVCHSKYPITIDDDSQCPKCGAKMNKKGKI